MAVMWCWDVAVQRHQNVVLWLCYGRSVGLTEPVALPLLDGRRHHAHLVGALVPKLALREQRLLPRALSLTMCNKIFSY